MSGRWRAGICLLIATAGFVLAPIARAAADLPAQAPAMAREPPVKAELLADASAVAAVAAGQPFKVGVLLRIAPEWHIYWKYPGDAGLPTTVTFDLPQGFTAGELQWPLPQSFVQPGNIIGYGYTDSVMLMAEITPPKNLPAGEEFTIGAKVSWLSCRDVCRLARAELNAKLSVAPQRAPANEELFREWAARLPRAKDDLIASGCLRSANATAGLSATGMMFTVAITWETKPAKVEFFPAPTEAVLTGKPAVVTAGNRTQIEMSARVSGVGKADGLDGLVAFTLPNGERDGFPVRVRTPAGGNTAVPRP